MIELDINSTVAEVETVARLLIEETGGVPRKEIMDGMSRQLFKIITSASAPFEFRFGDQTKETPDVKIYNGTKEEGMRAQQRAMDAGEWKTSCNELS